MAVPGQSFVRVRDVTDPQLQTGMGPFHDLALRFLIAACWRLTFQFFGAHYVPIGLFDERELELLTGSRSRRDPMPWRLIGGDLDGALSAACGTSRRRSPL